MSIRILSTLTDSAYQRVSFDTNKGERVDLTLRFIPSQETWFVDVKSNSLTINGLALQTYVNLLDPYHNIMSWGMYVWSKDGLDPWRIDDFVSGRIKIAILEDLEMAVIQEMLNG